MGDPETFLSVRASIIQFVIVKPVLGILIMLLKLTDSYSEG
jgi:hypothetical protein